MQAIHFEENPESAIKAFQNRSMFNRDYYMLLLYMGDHKTVDSELQGIKDIVGRVSTRDLAWRMPRYFFKNALTTSLNKLIQAFKAWNPFVVMPGKKLPSFHRKNLLKTPILFWRMLCISFGTVGGLIMYPVNTIYGLLDSLCLKVARVYDAYSRKKHPKRTEQEHLNASSKVALRSALLTFYLRLPAGLVEAIQEPFHLIDFWVKGWVDAKRDYKNGVISRRVRNIKLTLHAFKVTCTFGAILSIVGITMIPFISQGFNQLAKTAESLNIIKNKLPFKEYYLEAPINALKNVIIYIEKGIENIFGFNNSYLSEKTNAEHAIELGFEAGLTKPAELLPKKRTFTPGYDALTQSPPTLQSQTIESPTTVTAPHFAMR